VPDEDEMIGDHRLRIGRWLPSHEPASRQTVRDRAAPSVEPSIQERAAEPPVEANGDGYPDRSPRQRALIAAIVLTVLILPVTVIGSWWGGGAPESTGSRAGSGYPVTDLPLPAGAASISTSPSESGSASPDVQTPRPGSAGGPTADADGGMPVGMGDSVPAVPDPSMVPGRVVGLEPASAPGYRVRHRDFVGRIDRIGPNSSRLDRADSSFTVRAGLGDGRCVSFESVNYPGFFLRHQNFAIALHRADRTALFAADATFCVVTGLTGQHTSFRSLNYPDRYLVHRGYLLRIEPVDRYDTTRVAMTFVVTWRTDAG
jgi:hypothetical protein